MSKYVSTEITQMGFLQMSVKTYKLHYLHQHRDLTKREKTETQRGLPVKTCTSLRLSRFKRFSVGEFDHQIGKF